jgi:hypothetical protein
VSGFVLIIVLGPGLALLVLLGMLLAAALGVDGFHSDRHHLAPVRQPVDQQVHQPAIKVTSTRIKQAEAAS